MNWWRVALWSGTMLVITLLLREFWIKVQSSVVVHEMELTTYAASKWR